MHTNEEKNSSDKQLEQLQALTPQKQRFVHLYTTGSYSKEKLAELLDVHPNTIFNWLRDERVKSLITEMQTVTHEYTSTQLKAMSQKAMRRLADLMDSPMDAVALQAVKDVLDRGGHKPESKSTKTVNHNVRTFEEKMKDVIDMTVDDVEDGDYEESN